MELNIETLTKEQRKQLDMGYKIYLNEDNKLVTEEPIAPFTSEFIEYKKELINKEFQNSINQFTADYLQCEIDTWNEKQAEAQKVLLGETSDFLNNLVIEGETVEDLANKIITNAALFKTAYADAERNKRMQLKLLEL